MVKSPLQRAREYKDVLLKEGRWTSELQKMLDVMEEREEELQRKAQELMQSIQVKFDNARKKVIDI